MMSVICAHSTRWFVLTNKLQKCCSCLALQNHSCLKYQKRPLSSAPHFDASSAPVIKVPKGLSIKLEEIQKQTREGPVKWRGRLFTARPGKLLISAKRKEFNYYQNQKYDKFKPPVLASGGWKHKKSVGDYFTILAYKGNPSFSGDSENPVSFHDYELDKQLTNALQKMNIKTPSVIQNLAIPRLLARKNSLCAAETGSGKTLAYLLPIVQHLLSESRSPHNIATQPGYPRVLVIVPARELAQQVFSVVKTLIEGTSLRAKYIEGTKGSTKTLRMMFDVPLDIIVSTPGVMQRGLREDIVSLDLLSHVVIDEVDTLLDDSFSKSILQILRRIRISEHESDIQDGFTQLVLVGATMPKLISETLKDVISEDALQIISTPQLHRVMPHVNQKFLRLHSCDKAVTLVELVKRDNQAGIPVMVFCNNIPTCDWLTKLLEESNIKVLRMHGSNSNREKREGVLDLFMKGVANVLVCTDVSSRGVDTIKVRHVINFDFPNHISDYIHRAGRVGRVGSENTGHVTSFVVQKWDVDVVNRIERAVHARQDLPRVNANIKQRLTNRLEEQDAMAIKSILSQYNG